MVSILITTYNSAGFLQRCLESVLQQDYTDREVIIVDNASTDGTREILKEFGYKFADKCAHGFAAPKTSQPGGRWQVIYNDTNHGFAGGQNQGMGHSRGEWLFSLNPDVILSPEFLTKLLAAADT